jgi:hypothetical protein
VDIVRDLNQCFPGRYSHCEKRLGHAKETRVAAYTAGKDSKAQWQEAKKNSSSAASEKMDGQTIKADEQTIKATTRLAADTIMFLPVLLSGGTVSEVLAT